MNYHERIAELRDEDPYGRRPMYQIENQVELEMLLHRAQSTTDPAELREVLIDLLQHMASASQRY